MGAFEEGQGGGSLSVWSGKAERAGRGSAFVGVSWWVDLVGRRDGVREKKRRKSDEKVMEK